MAHREIRESHAGANPSALSDPLISIVHDGVVADVRAYDLEPDGRIALEVMLQAANVHSRTVPTRAKFTGTVDFPTSRGILAVVAAVTRPDVPVESVLWAGGDRYRVQLTARRSGPKPRQGHRGTLRRYDVGFHVLHHWYAMARQGNDRNWQMMRPFIGFNAPPTEPHIIAEMLAHRAPLAKFAIEAEGGLLVSGSLADQRIVRDALTELAGSCATGMEIDLTLRAPESIVGRYRLPAIDGRPCLARVGTDKASFLDAEVEVG